MAGGKTEFVWSDAEEAIVAIVDGWTPSSGRCFDAGHKDYVQYKTEQEIHLCLIVFRVVDHPANGQQRRQPN